MSGWDHTRKFFSDTADTMWGLRGGGEAELRVALVVSEAASIIAVHASFSVGKVGGVDTA